MTGWLGVLTSAAFLAGLMGGVHCAAMCGGWVAATCRGKSRGLAYPLAYNAGRLSVRREAGAHLFHRLLHGDLKRGTGSRLAAGPAPGTR